MSTAEIIAQIKALPDDDFHAVAKYIDEARNGKRTKGLDATRSGAIRPGFHEAAGEVFERYDDLFRELAK